MSRSYRERWLQVVANRTIRVGEENKHEYNDHASTPRNQFQRDFDRIIFSASFKRLQNKTQVFPLPGTTQVHNRLTHSLEVASVGRSLGNIVGNEIAQALTDEHLGDESIINFYRYELKDVILAACLAHDMGNPCFGHSGEAIISDYFKEWDRKIKKKPSLINPLLLSELKKITSNEWEDLIHFEGNANTLRMLTNHYKGKLSGGLRLTYLTLASIIKYPWGSSIINQGSSWENKYGFFLEQQELLKKIAKVLNFLPLKKQNKNVKHAFCRHPFVYLVEAADDICYLIMDMEDAHKVGIFSVEKVKEYFLKLIRELDFKLKLKLDLTEINKRAEKIKDLKEQIVYLRSKAINTLTEAVARVFKDKEEEILLGKLKGIIKDVLTDEYKITALQDIINCSKEKIYEHQPISETMIAASKILPDLLDLFLPAILISDDNYQRKKLFNLIDDQFTNGDREQFMKYRPYERILCLLDYITGMTDEYVFELYRKLMGIERNYQ